MSFLGVLSLFFRLGGHKLTLWNRNKELLDSITPEVVENLQGNVVAFEGEDDEVSEANL